MAEKHRGLGRGLSALLGEAEAVENQTAGGGDGAPHHVPIELLRRNPDQPRRVFDEAELEALAESIRDHGVIQPILVRPAPGAAGEYQIVAGERRWRAAQKAGHASVPVVVRNLDDDRVYEMAIVENVQRADLNPIEEAQAYKVLVDRFGHTQDGVAQVVGKSRSHVANMMRLLYMPQSVQDHVSAGRLTPGHARAIGGSDEADALARRVIEGGLSVRQAEELGRSADAVKADKPARKAPAGAAKDADTRALETDLSDALGLSVAIADKAGAGVVTIRYATLEQLDEVCRRLTRA